jgi:hypothetical protein
VAGEEFQHAMPPAQDVATDIVAAAQQVAARLFRLVGHVDGGELPGPIEAHQLGRVAAVGLDSLPGAPRRQRRRDNLTEHPEGCDPPIEVVTETPAS